ncbi:50S ribosomal protein L4 [Halalkalicoccus jeotgali]|uniref:Large ribosomal subunit protein uL4 n=1 Tax=Halalkalicoccus jeotgali (strain DSM 18796 / CECT 7217 / JCM 14584 / KCTC 4019 / B3) TaxID=795797 RepID=D8J9I6_HALJB|nr:50S ribosomal protein L4 [Halalkalicoccus jeotgali]ADJ14398.1 50S ribosomal protein L4P [Halalkalicoccus jeotgali B3]ELY40659.1 50S ribosomal protein L4P [Halalkalicoccus jeotgali B3]
MQATTLDLDGEEAGEIDLPEVFETTFRPDLIKRAVLAAQANRQQDYGADPFSGKRTSAESLGTGRGMARVPRSNGQGKRVPQAVGGRRAHPPKAEKDRTLDINTKERKLATRSAIAATTDTDLVAERGHRFGEDVSLPLVVSDEFEELIKTKEVLSFLESVGIADDIERAEDGRSVRAGRGKTRGRKYKQPKSILFVTSSEAGPSKAARNLAGVDVATAREVSAEDLAPGTHAGRLTVWTESAIEEVAGR